MKIWLITVGEPLPTDGDERLLRAGMLGEMLSGKGHDVTFWTSTFNHTKKAERFKETRTIQYKKNYRFIFLHSAPYKSNISPVRIINHYGIASQFAKLSLNEEKPDIILSSYPTIELCAEAVKYGKKNSVPVVIDARDMWPDIFLNLSPRIFRPLMKIILSPMYLNARKAMSGASALFGITDGFVSWALSYAGRGRNSLDMEFPLAYDDSVPSGDNTKKAYDFWKGHGLGRGHKYFVACFFGTLGRQFELETVISAAKIISDKAPDVRFVICGSGDMLEDYRSLAGECGNVIFPGWIDKSQIWTLLRISSVGLAPYRSSEDFMLSYPNKSIEYLSAGLPIISSLKGTLQKLLDESRAGLTYENNNKYDFIGKLLSLRDNPKMLKKMSGNAAALYKEKFIAKNVYGNMIDRLIEIAGKKQNKK